MSDLSTFSEPTFIRRLSATFDVDAERIEVISAAQTSPAEIEIVTMVTLEDEFARVMQFLETTSVDQLSSDLKVVLTKPPVVIVDYTAEPLPAEQRSLTSWMITAAAAGVVLICVGGVLCKIRKRPRNFAMRLADPDTAPPQLQMFETSTMERQAQEEYWNDTRSLLPRDPLSNPRPPSYRL